MWIALALGSAFFTAVIGTLTKAGLDKVDPYVALAIQATILTVLAWIVVMVQHKIGGTGDIDRKAWFYLGGAGVAMMVGYVCYFSGLKQGSSSTVQPLDRLSLVFAIGMAAIFLKEKLNWASLLGGGLMAVGAIVIATGSPKGK